MVPERGFGGVVAPLVFLNVQRQLQVHRVRALTGCSGPSPPSLPLTWSGLQHVVLTCALDISEPHGCPLMLQTLSTIS